MARKPANTISPLETRDALWASIRAFERPFTSRELRYETRCSTSQTGDFLKGLTAAGYLTTEKDPTYNGPIARNIYTLIWDCGVDAPRVRRDGSEVTQGRGREQMWETMRTLNRFTARDIHIFGSTDDHQIKLSEAKDYCFHLAKAGYLKGDVKGYLLVKRTGPKPPMIQRTKQVFDPNLNEIVWREGVTNDNK